MLNVEKVSTVIDCLERKRADFRTVDAILGLAGFEVLDVDDSDPERIIERYWSETDTKWKYIIIAFELDPLMGCSNYEVREEYIEDVGLFR